MFKTNRSAQWSAEMISFQFLNEKRMVIAAQTAGDTDLIPGYGHGSGHLHGGPYQKTKTMTPRLLLGDISNSADPTIPVLRVFKFPETWTAISSINIIPNLSSPSESCTAPGTLFYADPAKRIFAVSIEFDPDVIGRNQASHLMVVLEESFFQPAMRNEPMKLGWPQWEHSCIVNNMSDHAYCFKVVGRRLLHLQSNENLTAPTSRLYTVEFKLPGPSRHHDNQPYHNAAGPPMICPSRGTAMMKNRMSPSVRTNAMEVYNVTLFDASEDSIVLYEVSFPIFNAPTYSKNVTGERKNNPG